LRFDSDIVFVICVFQDKAPYIATAEKKKEEYEKAIRAYNLGLVFDLFFSSLLIFATVIF
jgi:hypothetical protein